MNSEPSNRSGDAEDAVSIRTATTMSESDFIIPEGKSPINMSKVTWPFGELLIVTKMILSSRKISVKTTNTRMFYSLGIDC